MFVRDLNILGNSEKDFSLRAFFLLLLLLLYRQDQRNFLLSLKKKRKRERKRQPIFKDYKPIIIITNQIKIIMSDTLYSQREEQNNKKFDELASTLNRFRTTIDQDIHGQIQQENSLLDSLNDNFNSMMILVKKTSGELRNVMNRNASLTRIVGLILLAFFVIWMLYKLY